MHSLVKSTRMVMEAEKRVLNGSEVWPSQTHIRALEVFFLCVVYAGGMCSAWAHRQLVFGLLLLCSLSPFLLAV